MFDELESFERKIANAKDIAKELYGKVQITQLPFELQEEFTRSKLRIPPHVWDEYDCETKGKTIAIEIISSQLESLERFEGILERNKNKK